MGNDLSDSNLSDSITKIYQAARDGTADLSDLLKRLKTDERNTALETKTKDGDQISTPLIIAARNGNLESVKILLRYNADIEARGTVKDTGGIVVEGCTALWAAALVGHLDVVELLIERNAEVDSRTLTDSTPLRAAAYHGRLDIVIRLVEHGADVNARQSFGKTPLMVTCYNGHMNVATYLVKHGANIHLQDKKGNTCLHHAAEGGHVEVVSKLLALGAKEKQNYKRLTPLLVASNYCKIEMVESFIKKPECIKEQRIDALELLGATIANNGRNVYDIKKAFSYMKRGMEERYEDPSHPLLKKKMEPIEAYQNRKESQTLEELDLLEGDDHAIHMEGLIIRERILGADKTELLFPIRYRGADFADSEQYELCFGLWRRSMEIAVNCDEPITKDLHYFAFVFGLMVQKGRLLRPKCIEDVFENLVAASERLTEKLKSEKLQEEYKNEEEEKMLFYALYLLMIYTKVKVLDEIEMMTDFVQGFLRLNPRTQNGNTLLHLAAWHESPINLGDDVRSAYKLPCVETMKLIVHAGCDVNAVNTEGNTPLHLAVTFKPGPGQVENLKEMLELLLDIGADTKLANTNGQTAVDYCETDEARRILAEKAAGLDAMNVDVRAVRKF